MYQYTKVLAAALLALPALAHAQFESTSHGTLTQIETAYGKVVDPNRPRDYWDYELVKNEATGAASAEVPGSHARTAFGHSSMLLDVREETVRQHHGVTMEWIDGGYQSGKANARWWDTWTVLGGSGAGKLTVALEYSADWRGDTWLTYALEQRSATGKRRAFQIETGMNAWSFEPGDLVTDSPASRSVHQVEIPFEYGEAFQLVSTLSGYQLNHPGDGAWESMSVKFLSVSLAAGATLQVSSGDASVYGVSPVPEPSSWGLMLMGTVGVLAAARRRRR